VGRSAQRRAVQDRQPVALRSERPLRRQVRADLVKELSGNRAAAISCHLEQNWYDGPSGDGRTSRHQILGLEVEDSNKDLWFFPSGCLLPCKLGTVWPLPTGTPSPAGRPGAPVGG
jgi:hypothetical protein